MINISKTIEFVIYADDLELSFDLFFEFNEICRVLTYAHHDNHYHVLLSFDRPVCVSIIEDKLRECLLDCYKDIHIAFSGNIAKCSHLQFLEYLNRCCDRTPILLHRVGLNLKFPSTCRVKKIKK